MNRRFASAFVVIVCFNCINISLAPGMMVLSGIDDRLREADELTTWSEQAFSLAASRFEGLAGELERTAEFQRASDCFRRAARFQMLLGNNRESLRLLERALADGRHDTGEASNLMTLSQLAVVNVRLGNLTEVQQNVSDINGLSKTVEDSVACATAFAALGEVALEQKHVDESITDYERALNSWGLTAPSTGQAETLVGLAYAYMAKGDMETSLQRAEQAFEISQQIADLRAATIAEIALGTINSRMENNRVALDFLQQAAKSFPDGVDGLEHGDLYNRLGQIYFNYRDYQNSLECHKKAVDLYRLENNPYAEIGTIIFIGRVQTALGDRVSAIESYRRGQELVNTLHDDYYQATLKKDIGDLYFVSEPQKSVSPYEEALAYFQEHSFKKQIAAILNNLGIVYTQLGNTERALNYFQSAIQISREINSKFGEAESLAGMSETADRLGNRDLAYRLASEAVAVTESLDRESINSKLSQAYFSDISERYGHLVKLLMQKRDNRAETESSLQALQMVEIYRCRTLLESLTISDAKLIADADPEFLAQFKDLRVSLNSKTDNLSDLLSRNGEPREIEKIGDEIRQLQFELEDLKTKIKRASPVYSAIKNPEPFDLADFQSRVLRVNSVVLEFSLGVDESYLWIVGKDSFDAYYLPKREEIEGRVERLRAILKSRELRPGESAEDFQKRVGEAEVEYRKEAHALSDEILGQVGDKIKRKRLIVVADGKLQYFPIGSLPMPNSEGDDPILLNQEVVYEPSASALKLIKTIGASKVEPKKDLLVFADPVFSKSDDRLTGLETSMGDLTSIFLGLFRSGEAIDKLPRLPASNEEAQAIANVVGASRSSVRSGFDANRDAVLNGDITDYKILHFATHGLMNESRPELSGILLSLYGRDGKQNDGGFIRLQDVYGMNLNADLVVLSACDTGVGKDVKGEGLMSLNNAFLQAGAKSVVSSLWKVDDEATKELMTSFYGGLANDGLTTSAALRQAQIKMYNDPRFRSPFYWAAFTVEGDYSSPPKLGHSFDKRFLLLGVVPLLIAIYVFRRRRGLGFIRSRR